MEISFLFEQYVAYMTHIKDYSPSTIRWYRSTFLQFKKTLNVENIHCINQFTVENWLMDGRIKNMWLPSTFISHHKHLNCFFEWMKKKGSIPDNFIKDIEKPRLEQRIPRRLSLEQADVLLRAIYTIRWTYKFEKQKNLAIIALMLFAWLRKSEVLKLKTHNINMDTSIIHIVQAKWKKDRLVPMCSRLQTIIKEYLLERDRLDKSTDFLINPSQWDSYTWPKAIDRLIKRLREKTKLDFSAHALRHTFATLMLEWWCDIYTLSKMMWHSKINTTTIYLSCSEKSLLQSIEKHPLN